MEPQIISVNDSDLGYFDLDFYDPKLYTEKEQQLQFTNEEEYQEI
jgi:hypothetical protein